MNISKVYLITFSPTRTSYNVGKTIADGLGGSECVVIDLTLPAGLPAEVVEIEKEALAVLTVPVYGGHLPKLAVERLQQLRGNGTPAVVAVVYGNRAYEKALVELDALAGALGFKVIAGGTFVGEHSYSTSQYPIAQGRPDADDLEYARLFGCKVRTKVGEAADLEHLYGVDVRRIQRPHQPFFKLLKFARGVMKMRKSPVPAPRTPDTDAARCNHCGLCAKLCPTGAIVAGDELHTDASKCIKCCACVKGCKQGARTLNTPFAPLIHDCFPRQKENRIIV